MENLMSEKYQEFNAADYVKTDANVRELSGRLRMRTPVTEP